MSPPSRSANFDPGGNSDDRTDVRTNVRTGARANPTTLEERELDAALQLLVERAQYITGATGTALALPQGDEMVCRASAGACAPTVGARLQVQSGLTGESIARRQLLRCDNAEADPRVNLETCHALGIASIVVLPLLRRDGEVRGLFELFSDHPYAFEERDLVALERMAALTLTALDLAEQQHETVTPAPPAAKQTKPIAQTMSYTASATYSPKETAPPSSRPEIQPPEIRSSEPQPGLQVAPLPAEVASAPAPFKAAQLQEASSAKTAPAGDTSTLPTAETAPTMTSTVVSVPVISSAILPPSVVSLGSASPNVVSPEIVSANIQSQNIPSPVVDVLEPPPAEPAPVPEAMRRVQKCSACGFPVSEGRKLCLDCESAERQKLERQKIESEKRGRENDDREDRPIEAAATGIEAKVAETKPEGTKQAETKQAEISRAATKEDPSESSTVLPPDEILPPFLTNPQLVEESWLARHVNLLAFLVLIAAVLVAAVVFFR
jgi:putative methionine-R-sulfoxide reductase with GAF domain